MRAAAKRTARANTLLWARASVGSAERYVRVDDSRERKIFESRPECSAVQLSMPTRDGVPTCVHPAAAAAAQLMVELHAGTRTFHSST